jgi:hypothetical protein
MIEFMALHHVVRICLTPVSLSPFFLVLIPVAIIFPASQSQGWRQCLSNVPVPRKKPAR